MSQLNFDATNVPPASAPEAIPTDWYVCQMTGSEMKPTSDNSGAYLNCEFTILAGQYAGRKIFDRINLQNKNPTAVEIGYRTLSAICHSVGVIQVGDSQQLHGRPLQVRVVFRPAGPGGNGQYYDASNEIRGYKAVDGASVSGAPAAPAWANQQPAAAPQQQWAPPPAAAPAPAPAPAPQQWAAPPAAAPQFPQFQPPPAAAPAAPPAATPPWAVVPPPAATPAAQPQQPPAAQPQGGAPVPPWLQQPNG